MRFSICGLHTLPIIHAALLVRQVMEVQIFKRCIWEFMFLLLQMCVCERVFVLPSPSVPSIVWVIGWVCFWKSSRRGLICFIRPPSVLWHQKRTATSARKPNNTPYSCAPHRHHLVCECVCVWRTWAKGTCLTSLDEHLVPLLGICSHIHTRWVL